MTSGQVTPFEESPLTEYFDHFRSLPMSLCAKRLLSEAHTLALCPLTQLPESWDRAADAWSSLRLPFGLLHPGLLSQSAKAYQTLLGVTTQDLEDVIYHLDRAPKLMVVTPGTSGLRRGEVITYERRTQHEGTGLVAERGSARVRECALALYAAWSPDASGQLGNVALCLQRAGAGVEWLFPQVVPIPPASLRDEVVEQYLARVVEIALRSRRLIDLGAPEIIQSTDQALMQNAWTSLYFSLVKHWDQLAPRSSAKARP